MQTITFYSYKGGVGRTLALANVARYLSTFGQRVFVMDFDLEAPGLHHKLLEQDPPPLHRGLVDIVALFLQTGRSPSSLEDYVIEVPAKTSSGGRIFLLPAGKAPTAEYWHALSCINWHELLHSAGEAETPSPGLLLFLEIKALIEKDYQPDFLLIDSRTGITEIGGVATSILADQVVCLLLNNRENLEGTRAVLRALQSSLRLPDQEPVEILTVLTRLPISKDPEPEDQIVNRVRDFLNEEADDLAQTLSLQEVFVFHSEPELELQEALRVGGAKGPEESPLLGDYLRLFARLIPSETIEKNVQPLINESLARSLDNPDQTQRDLEILAASTVSPIAQEALLKFLRLRQVGGASILRVAHRLWELTHDASNPLIVEAVMKNRPPVYDAEMPAALYHDQIVPSSFVEAVWRTAGASSMDVGLPLAKGLSRMGKGREAQEVANELVDAVEQGKTRRPDLDDYAELLLIADRKDELLMLLDEGLQGVGRKWPVRQVAELYGVFRRAGLEQEFDTKAKQGLGEDHYRRLKEMMEEDGSRMLRRTR